MYFVFTEKRKCFCQFFINQSPKHIYLAVNFKLLRSFSLQPEPMATEKSSSNNLPCLYLKREVTETEVLPVWLASCCFWCSGQSKIHALHLWTLYRSACRPLTVPAIKTWNFLPVLLLLCRVDRLCSWDGESSAPIYTGAFWQTFWYENCSTGYCTNLWTESR